MQYELWNTDSDELMGTIDVPQPFERDHKVRVIVRVKEGWIEDLRGNRYNAVQVLCCQMKRIKTNEKYWALETNLPIHLAMKLEGFTPRVRVATAAENIMYGRLH